MSSNTYTVDTPNTGILGYTLAVFCLSDLLSAFKIVLYIQKMSLRVQGGVLHNLLQSVCTTEGYSIKQTTNKYSDHHASFIRIEKAVIKQILQ